MPLPRIKHKARLFAVLLTPFLIYWGFLPLFWPAPDFSAELPAEAPLTENLVIPIEVRAWHPNLHVVTVRFYVDYYNSDVHGPEGTFYPQLIYQGELREPWTTWDVNRFSWPRRRQMEATLPLPDLVKEGVVQPGTVHGKLDVTVAWPDVTVRGGRFLGGFPTRSKMLSQPFEMQFVSSEESPASP